MANNHDHDLIVRGIFTPDVVCEGHFCPGLSMTAYPPGKNTPNQRDILEIDYVAN